ncbi:hypothetical protein VTP01DRAFT_659 [Rhizomucor pusillus]|uniref:uncharacterized protein n=1 Tax=Rhizomucor pusillus TaxID=4840 RepID=UPI00374354D4
MSARPNSSLLCYTDVVRINNSRQGIQAQAIERDVDLLLTLFVAQEKHDFSNFVNAWRKLDFASIHYACMYPESREAFMQAIYDAILDHFGSNIRAKKIGVIYALYFMYKTQPSALPTAYIRVTMETYSALIDYYEYCVLSGRTDLIKVASVIYEMKMEYAICIVARPAMMPANHKEIAELEKNIKLLEEIRDFKKKK